ncbi:hypothetical protein [Pseudalkalibacillus berkeleyi]|uniref:DUF3278 domain-containing protein n=1 Tax=Pseudalkalibacillus berkeleyi TaxID=1069813 RepID=A0ABS9GY66_9BACL|nr:hypothetical protein [Pseudalkalibacillus berkeleyi]MCF6136550.1 hypothetical protein [Pseudalkalibacillus berkeleyi]
MEQERLLILRKAQLLYLNIHLIVAIVLISFVFESVMTLNQLFVFVAVINIAQSIMIFKTGKPIGAMLSEKMKELYEYEAEKMGAEWRAQKKLNAFALLFVGLLFIFNAWVVDNDQPIHSFDMFPMMFFVFFFLIVLMNVTNHLHSRKVDRGFVKKGYTKKMFLYSLAIGVVTFSIMNLILMVGVN